MVGTVFLEAQFSVGVSQSQHWGPVRQIVNLVVQTAKLIRILVAIHPCCIWKRSSCDTSKVLVGGHTHTYQLPSNLVWYVVFNFMAGSSY